MPELCKISFPETNYSSINLSPHQNLSEHLTIQNSPVLFGCRTGICGTCLVEVIGEIPPPKPDEQEMLDALAPDNKKARLVCQIELTNNIEIRIT
ncbi:(2Fe-2S)-binding protein [Nostoc linckia FACHB-104]|nr:(2Fe-2S)-binding protein [Nostoc linckia FACHB-104]